MLDRITPVILTFNEAPNIERTLARLDWASRIVIVDSGSMDETVELARRNPRVDLRERPFDEHARQWNYAITETNVRSEWVLALDADYVLTEDFLGEISRLDSHPDVTGYEARFIYYVFGQPLRGSLYPPVTVLFRAGRGHYVQDGHTQRLVVAGQV